MNKLALIIIILFSNCQNYESPSRLLIAIEQISFSKHIEKNEINLKDVYNFEWELLYIFKEHVEPKDISEIIGFDCECEIVPDGLEMYIFIYNGSIVEKNIVETTGYDFNIQNYLDLDKSIVINSKNSKFIILDKKSYYLLEPINNIDNSKE
ncbi:hypothetical protein [uncultured Winogradskyella sp.]|uniref:hypothetical protein n=1 Tax=uncultured Winogradskyella sp. TaxID=395353 RepID=UPI00262E6CC3|nr:hypothetical protein [uncultured Winogradskyella sp.]